jgi:hypothetical protein
MPEPLVKPIEGATVQPSLVSTHNSPWLYLQINGEVKGAVNKFEVSAEAMQLVAALIGDARDVASIERTLTNAAGQHGDAYPLVATAALHSLAANILIPLLDSHPDGESARQMFKSAAEEETNE